MLSLPSPRHMPCEHCGASVERAAAPAHECDDERRLEFRVFALRDEIESFDATWASWLQTPHGRFELFYAEHIRRA
jgi:hypothetical protein